MDHKIASHLLKSANIAELKDTSTLIPSSLDASDHHSFQRELHAQLTKASQFLGVKLDSDDALFLAKDRLIRAMEETAKLVGLGDDGQILRGVDFDGATKDGVLSASSARDLVNPERPHMKGVRFILDSTASGNFMPKSSKSLVSSQGLVAMTPSRIAHKLVQKIESVAGFEGVWDALSECSSHAKRLESLGGVDCFSREELRTQLTHAFSNTLESLPLGPSSDSFPHSLEDSSIVHKIKSRRLDTDIVPSAPKMMA